VNLEYLRNVILQFLEHKEMRVSLFSDGRRSRMLMFFFFFRSQPNLVRILTTILRFTPQETQAAQSQPMNSPLSLQYIDVFVLCAVFYVSCLIVLRTISTTERDGVLFFVIVRSEFPTTSQSGNQGRSAMLVQAANAAGK
jgi:hypothetical protein